MRFHTFKVITDNNLKKETAGEMAEKHTPSFGCPSQMLYYML